MRGWACESTFFKKAGLLDQGQCTCAIGVQSSRRHSSRVQRPIMGQGGSPSRSPKSRARCAVRTPNYNGAEMPSFRNGSFVAKADFTGIGSTDQESGVCAPRKTACPNSDFEPWCRSRVATELEQNYRCRKCRGGRRENPRTTFQGGGADRIPARGPRAAPTVFQKLRSTFVLIQKKHGPRGGSTGCWKTIRVFYAGK